MRKEEAAAAPARPAVFTPQVNFYTDTPHTGAQAHHLTHHTMPVANRSRCTLARRTNRNKPLGVGSNRIDPEGLTSGP